MFYLNNLSSLLNNQEREHMVKPSVNKKNTIFSSNVGENKFFIMWLFLAMWPCHPAGIIRKCQKNIAEHKTMPSRNVY